MRMSMDQEGIYLLDQLQGALENAMAETTAREAALGEAILQTSAHWTAWHAQWVERSHQLRQRQQALQELGSRAVSIAAEAEAELQETEGAIREWVTNIEMSARS